MEKLILKSYSYLMNSSYERIAGGKSYDISFKPYEKKFVNKMIKYFEEYEEYEKCDLLMKTEVANTTNKPTEEVSNETIHRSRFKKGHFNLQ